MISSNLFRLFWFIFGFFVGTILFMLFQYWVFYPSQKSIIRPTIITEVKPIRQSFKFINNNMSDDLKNINSILTPDYQNILTPKFSQPSKPIMISDILKENVRIFCWIMTAKNNTDKATAVNATWSKRCNKVVYITPDEVNS